MKSAQILWEGGFIKLTDGQFEFKQCRGAGSINPASNHEESCHYKKVQTTEIFCLVCCHFVQSQLLHLVDGCEGKASSNMLYVTIRLLGHLQTSGLEILDERDAWNLHRSPSWCRARGQIHL